MYPLTEGSRFSKGSKGVYMVKSPAIPQELVISKKGRRMEMCAEGSNSIISWNAKVFLKEDKSCFNKYFQIPALFLLTITAGRFSIFSVLYAYVLRVYNL